MTVEQIVVLQIFFVFASVFLPSLCRLFFFILSILGFLYVCFSSLADPSFFLSYCGLSTPAGMKTVSFSELNSFLPRHCGLDLRQETCEFKDLYFWRNCRKSNLLSNDTNLAIFGPLRLEIKAINRDSIWSAGNSGLIQSLFFDLLFGL